MTILSNDSGILSCSVCLMKSTKSNPWCAHIEDYIKSGNDAPEIWEDHIASEQLEISVPYFPTHLQWAICKLGIAEYDNRICLLSSGEELEFLGFVSRGEGRAVIRMMIHEWFFPRIDTDAECSSNGHGYAAQLEWNKVMKNKDLKLKLAERWSVFNTGKCLYCTNEQKSNYDDLVPDVSGVTTWSSIKPGKKVTSGPLAAPVITTAGYGSVTITTSPSTEIDTTPF